MAAATVVLDSGISLVPSASDDPVDTVFAIGDAVAVFGLVSEAGAALNGRKGQIVRRNDVSGRWGVKFHDLTESKEIKGSNLRLVPMDESLQASKSDVTSVVEVTGGTAFAVGDEVKVFGLVSQLGAALNGQSGRIVSHKNVNGRWNVKIPNFTDIKQIKGRNLLPVKIEAESQLDVLAQFLHYAEPFDIVSPGGHGLHQVEAAIELFYCGCAVVYCDSKEDTAKVDAYIRSVDRWTKNGVPRCAAITDGSAIPFERARIITLINFGKPPSVTEYRSRVQRVFAISKDWPKSEPRGLVTNLVASSLSLPYTGLNMDTRDWSLCGKSDPMPWVSVFREKHPELLHDNTVNTFEKPSGFVVLEQAGISFKPLGDEGFAGGNIDEWHLMLGHYSGQRKYLYHTGWSWIGSPPDLFKGNPTITVNMADLLNPFSDTSTRLDSAMMIGKIIIPRHLPLSGVLELIRRQR